MSIQALSDEVGRLGLPIERPVLSNLENGRRHTVSLAELYVLAEALEVPALMLLFPLGRADAVEVLPGVEMTPWEALQWAERGPVDSDSPTNGPVHLFREHQEGVAAWRRAGREIRAAEKLLAVGAPEPDVEASDDAAEIRQHVEDFNRERARLAEALRHVRALIRGFDLTPPPLPLVLRHIDQEDISR